MDEFVAHSEDSTIGSTAGKVKVSSGNSDLSLCNSLFSNHDGLKLFRFGSKTDLVLIFVSVVANLGSGVLFPIFLAMFGDLFDTITMPSGKGPNYYVLWQLKLGGIAFAACTIGAGTMELAAERQLRNLRFGFLAAIMRQEMGWFDCHDSGQLSATISESCMLIRDAMGLKFAQLFMFLGLFVGGYGVGLYRGWRLALVLTAALPLVALGGFLTMRAMNSSGLKSRNVYFEASAAAEETLGAMHSVAAFGLESLMTRRYGALLQQSFKRGVKAAVRLGFGMGWTFATLFLTYALGFWYGGKLVADDLDKYGVLCATNEVQCFSGGQTIGVFFCVLMAAFSLGQAGPAMTAIAKASTAMSTLYSFLTRQSQIDPMAAGGHRQGGPLQGQITFKNVRFAYPTRRDRQVFKNLNLTIEAGQTVALVGASGCGKSTIVQLLERFYDVDRGQVLVDGKDVRDYNLKWLRQQMALVSQEPRLFATSIAENITAGKDVDVAAVQQATKAANAHDFVMEFPGTYDTYVGEAGSQLSGGQKQRIAIARAILRDPSILILDEATSALDNESEKIVQETLDKIVEQKARTTIIVAHRLTTVRKADKIIVLDNRGDGAIVVEEGTHAELINFPNGLYAALVAAQTMSGTDIEPVEHIVEIMSELKDSFAPSEVSAMKLRAKFQTSSSRTEVVESNQKPIFPISRRKRCCNTRFKQVFRLVTPYKWHIACGLLGAVLNGVVYPVFAICLSKFITSFYEPSTEEMRSKGRFWALTFIPVAGVSVCAHVLQQGAFGWAGEKVVESLRRMAFTSLVYQDMSFFDNPDHTTGKLSDVLSSDIPCCRGWIGDNLGVYLQNIVSIVASIIVAFLSSVKLASVCLAGFVVMVVGVFIESMFMAGTRDELDGPVEVKSGAPITETTGHILNEVLSNLKTVAAFTMDSSINSKYQRVVLQQYNKGRIRSLGVGFAWGFSQLLQYMVEALYLYYGAKLVVEENLGPDLMIRALFVLMMAAFGMGQSMIFLTDNKRAKAAANRVFNIIECKPLIDSRHATGEVAGELQHSIEFKDVAFVYPQRLDVPVFREVNFDIKKGEMVALVGASGCGKSTAVQLIERFYDTTSGNVLLDGKPIKTLNVRTIRSQIGLVSQEPVLFNMTIEENIALGNGTGQATIEEIEAAARMANADDFIQSFPDKFQTNVGQLGSQLSGGQKQRIAIARALIRNPPILVLDEATSALDSESEAIVQDALDKLLKTRERTTLVIAHRLSTIRNADKIVVFVNYGRQGSKVAEIGSHKQLMEIPNGVYRGLVKIAQG